MGFSRMIKRVFRAVVTPELQKEFEDKFANFAVPEVLSFQGCIDVQIFRPASQNSNEYLMVSHWESADTLKNQFGEKWEEAYIPQQMEKFFLSYSLAHYKTW